MAATPPVTLAGIPGNLLPRTISGPIFAKATETSTVMRLSRRVPLAMTANTEIPVPLDVPTADWVNEGGRKPISSGGIGVKTMQGKKVATLVAVSEEVARTNAAGLYQQLSQDLPTAIARAFDVAAIHGKTMKGGTGPFSDYLAMTSKSVTLGSAAQSEGGIYTDLVQGMADVTDDDWDFNGFVADKRLKPRLLFATDTTGRPIFVDTTTPGTDAAGGGTLIGEPLAYGSGISGKYRRQSGSSDSGLRAIGGDWSQCAYGVGMDITIKTSTEATYVDEDGTVHSAFQENLVLLLVEAYFGFVLGDPEAFVKYVGSAAGS